MNSIVKISVLAFLFTAILVSNFNQIEAAFFNNQHSNKKLTNTSQAAFQNQFVNASWLGDDLVIEGTYEYNLQSDEELLIRFDGSYYKDGESGVVIDNTTTSFTLTIPNNLLAASSEFNNLI